MSMLQKKYWKIFFSISYKLNLKKIGKIFFYLINLGYEFL